MATRLTFNKATIAGTTYDTDEFVKGSGALMLKGDDIQVVTDDGKIKNIRRTLTPEATFEVYGDKTAINTASGLGVAVEVFLGVTSLKAFTGLVSAKYNESSETTSITCKGDPE